MKVDPGNSVNKLNSSQEKGKSIERNTDDNERSGLPPDEDQPAQSHHFISNEELEKSNNQLNCDRDSCQVRFTEIVNADNSQHCKD